MRNSFLQNKPFEMIRLEMNQKIVVQRTNVKNNVEQVKLLRIINLNEKSFEIIEIGNLQKDSSRKLTGKKFQIPMKFRIIIQIFTDIKEQLIHK